ncbi:MAG: hypothetical protein IH623_05355 [Verrucomicrobia bacterium]|nr:hypothetical protein [Verrucomicrobiota bacterium]
MKTNNQLPGCRSRFALFSPPTSLVVLLLACLSSGWCPRSFGALICHDGADYPANSVMSGLNSGTGWAASWAGWGRVEVDGLLFPGLLTTANRFLTSGNNQDAYRNPRTLGFEALLSGGKFGLDGTELWLSFLVRRETNFPAGSYGGLSLLDFTAEKLFVGLPAGATHWSVRETDPAAVTTVSTAPIRAGESTLIVLRLQFGVSGVQDRMELFVNPSPGVTPTVPDAAHTGANLIFNRIRLQSGPFGSTAPMSLDEIRLGESYADVTPAVAGPAVAWLRASDQRLTDGAELTLPVSYAWPDGDLASLSLAVTAANPALLPGDGITITGTGANRRVTLRPTPGASGVTAVTATITPPVGAAVTASFNLTISPPPSGLVVHEPFAYTDGNLSARNGGQGFGGAWAAGVAGTGANLFTTTTPSLTFPGLLTAGARMRTAGGVGGLVRPTALTLGEDGTVRYVSLLLRPDAAPTATAYFGLLLLGSGGGNLFVGKPGGGSSLFYVVENSGGAAQVASTKSVVQNETTLLVLKLEFLPGPDRVSLYVNPVPGTEPAIADALKSDLDLGLVVAPALLGNAAWSSDELRVGTSFASVTPPGPDFQLRPVLSGFVTEHILVTRQVETVDPLPPGRTLTFALDGPTNGATIHATTGEFTWVPGELDGGQRRTFTVRATSNASPPASVTVSFYLDVNESNFPPELAAIPDQSVTEGSEFTYPLVAMDSDDPPQNISYSLSVKPEGLDVSSAGVLTWLTWRPTIAQAGRSYSVTVIASDGQGGRAERSFTITVENRTGFVARWIGTADGDWNNADNWDIGRVPNDNATEFFDVLWELHPVTVRVAGDVTVRSLSLSSGGTLELQSPTGNVSIQGSLLWKHGTLAGPGRMTVQGRATLEGRRTDTLTLRDQCSLVLNGDSFLGSPLRCDGNVRVMVQPWAMLDVALNGGFIHLTNGVPELRNEGTLHIMGNEQPVPFIYLYNRGTVITFASTIDFQTGAGLDMIQEAGGRLDVGAGLGHGATLNGNALFRQGSTVSGEAYLRQARVEGRIQGRFSFDELSFGPTAVSKFSLIAPHDHLSAAQPIALDGRLELAPLQGVIPGPDDVFQLVRSDGEITGQFTNRPFGQRVLVSGTNETMLLTRSADLHRVELRNFLPEATSLYSLPLSFRLPEVVGAVGGCFVVPHPAVTLSEGTVAGGTLTVEITENYNAAVDQLTFRPNSTFPEADDVVFEGAFGSVQTVRFRGTAFGTMQLADGLMTCNLNAQADSAAVVALLGRLRYENTELTADWFTRPDTNYPQRTVVVTLTDTNGANAVSRTVDFPFLWGIRLPESLQLTNGQQTVLHLQGWFSSQQVLPVPSLTTQWSESCTNPSVLVHPVALLGQQGVIGKAAPYCCTITAQAGLLSAATSLQDSLTEVIPWNELDPIKQGLAKLIFGEQDVQSDFERIVLENQSHACPLFIGMFLTERRVECETTPGGRVSAQGGGDDTNSITTFYTLEALMKGTVGGRGWAELYRQHGAEVVQLFFEHPSLFTQAQELVASFHPGVVALLAGQGDTVTITPPMITQVNAFWNLLAQYANPALKAALEQEQARFDNFQRFQNVTISEWAGLLGIRVPFQPYLHISLMRREPTEFSLALNDVPGLDLSLWRSLDLKTWGRVTNATFERDGVAIIFTDPTPPAGAAFYQVR